MKKKLAAIFVLTMILGVFGSLQAEQDQTRDPSSINRRPPLGDDGPGGDGKKD